MGSQDRGETSHKRMETKVRRSFPEGRKGRLGKQGSLGEKREPEISASRHCPCSEVGLKGIFPLSVGKSGRMELVKGNDLGNDFA